MTALEIVMGVVAVVGWFCAIGLFRTAWRMAMLLESMAEELNHKGAHQVRATFATAWLEAAKLVHPNPLPKWPGRPGGAP